MPIRQYIGARYVPKFYANPNNTAEWLNNVEYEPLTIVTYGPNTYTSKKFVPASVGDPGNNPDYWVCTSNYNAFINELQDEIDDINTDIGEFKESVQDEFDILRHRKVLVITDSYGVVSTTGWDEVFEQMAGITDFYNLKGSGYGFSRSGYKFIDLLTASASLIDDKTDFTDIVICCGANDSGVTKATLKSDISDFKTYCKTNYPNAKLHIGFISWALDRSTCGTYRNVCYNYRAICAELGIDYLKGVEAAMHNTDYFNTVDYPDGIHPNQAGNNAIGAAVAQAFYGHCSVLVQEVAELTPNTSNVTTSTAYAYTSLIYGDEVKVSLPDLSVTLLANHNVGDSVIIGTYTNKTFKGNLSIPIYSLNGYTDYLFTNWNGNVTLYLTHSVTANQTLSYYFQAPLNYDIMQT